MTEIEMPSELRLHVLLLGHADNFISFLVQSKVSHSSYCNKICYHVNINISYTAVSFTRGFSDFLLNVFILKFKELQWSLALTRKNSKCTNIFPPANQSVQKRQQEK